MNYSEKTARFWTRLLAEQENSLDLLGDRESAVELIRKREYHVGDSSKFTLEILVFCPWFSS